MECLWRMRLGRVEGRKSAEDYAVAFLLVFVGPVLSTNGGVFRKVGR